MVTPREPSPDNHTILARQRAEVDEAERWHNSETVFAWFRPLPLRNAHLLRQAFEATARGRGECDFVYAVLDAQGVRSIGHATGDVSTDGVATSIIGRHTHVDTRVAASSLSLRHVLLLRHHDAPEYVEVRDLRSEMGVRDAQEKIFSVGRFRLPFLLDLGSVAVVVDDPHDARSIDCKVEALRASHVEALPLQLAPASLQLKIETFVREEGQVAFQKIEPQFVEALLRRQTVDLSEPLENISKHAMRTISVHEVPAALLSAGFFFGRNARCHWPAQSSGENSSLSRVHAMLFESHGKLYVVDLGSTYGVQYGDVGDIRFARLHRNDSFTLSNRYRVQLSASARLPANAQNDEGSR